jgi:GT2 family glycosyltransferase
MPGRSLSATIVVFRSDPRLLARALRSLAVAVREARGAGLVGEMTLHVVDNGPAEAESRLEEALQAWDLDAGAVELHAGHGNVGYGRANNLVLERLASDVHLIMNPDVELEPGALCATLAALDGHPDVGMVAPAVYGDDGTPQYLCKRYPSVWVLFLRGFAPGFLRRRFARAIDDYEMRDVIADRFVGSVPLASGCFLVARTPLLVELGGFDPRFFMYFEDYDLSLRMGRRAGVAYVPEARIVHHGGEAARKGPRHIAWFVRSAWRFFATHGWKLA